MGEFNVNKTDGSLEQTAGMPSAYPATQVMMSDGVTSVEDALDGLTANGLGTRVEITSYTQSNRFTAPSDGYFIVYIQSGVEGYGCVENVNCSIGGHYYDVNSNHTARHGIYVRKGMHLFCTGSPYYAVFIPIS